MTDEEISKIADNYADLTMNCVSYEAVIPGKNIGKFARAILKAVEEKYAASDRILGEITDCMAEALEKTGKMPTYLYLGRKEWQRARDKLGCEPTKLFGALCYKVDFESHIGYS